VKRVCYQAHLKNLTAQITKNPNNSIKIWSQELGKTSYGKYTNDQYIQKGSLTILHANQNSNVVPLIQRQAVCS
jgi:hypothetical protein